MYKKNLEVILKEIVHTGKLSATTDIVPALE